MLQIKSYRVSACAATFVFLAAIGTRSAVAVPVPDTIFTYQGELKDNGGPAAGPYDMSFSLWDTSSGGIQIGMTIDKLGVAVTEGRFTVQLDMGANAFDNSSRWLEITVEGFTLSPRQPITRSPYSIQTRGIFVDDNKNVGIGTTNPQRELDIEAGEPALRLTATDSGPSATARVQLKSSDGPGIFRPLGVLEFVDETDTLRAAIVGNKAGPTAAQINLTVNPGQLPQMRVLDGSVRVKGELDVTRPSDGVTSASIGAEGADSFFQLHGGNVGIGTTSPAFPLHIQAAQPYVEFEDTGGGSSWLVGVQGPSVGLNIQEVGAATRFVINEGGNVGIGTTGPNADIHVVGDGAGTGVKITNGGGCAGTTNTGLIVGDVCGAGRAASFYGVTSNTLVSITNDGTGKAATFGGDVSFNGGDVGIGTSNPAVKLHVEGGSDSSPVGGGFLVLGSTGGTNISIDNNEIMARNNGATSTLFLNNNGGVISCGGTLDINYSIVSGPTDATCPAGTKILGGGCRISGNAEVRESYPSSSTNWHCVAGDQSGFITLTAYAICANVK